MANWPQCPAVGKCGCIPCKLYVKDTPILTIDSIVICQTRTKDLWRIALNMLPDLTGSWERKSVDQVEENLSLRALEGRKQRINKAICRKPRGGR
jgi:hypothetical protein